MGFLKRLWNAIFGGAPKTEPREDSNGNPVNEVPEKPDDTPKLPNGILRDYSGANKERYPNAKAFELDPTTGGTRITPKFVILHHTVSYDLQKTVDFFKKRDVSVHYVIGHDGAIIQMSENTRKCWHAGESSWKGYTGLNAHSVGIEVVNMGPLKKKGDKFYDYYDKLYTGPVHARKGLGYEYWEAIRPAQEAATIELCRYLHEVLNIPVENFLGHYEIAPKRKNDPYGLFTMGDMSAFRNHLKRSV